MLSKLLDQNQELVVNALSARLSGHVQGGPQMDLADGSLSRLLPAVTSPIRTCKNC